jgi:predicted benzoate:H+ symporter BenE
MENYINQFISLVDGAKLLLLGALIVANFLVGVAVSIYTKKFRLKMIADFMCSRVLPYLVCYLAVGIVAIIEPAWAVAVTIVWGIILAALVGAILSNLKEIGINLPDSIAGDNK